MAHAIAIKIHHESVPALLETDWRRFILGKGNGNFFQSPEILSLYRDIKKYSTLVITAHDTGDQLRGVLVAVLIRERIKGISFPRLLVQGGPVIDGNDEDRAAILDKLLSALKNEIPPDTVFIEIRNIRFWEKERELFIKHGFTWRDHLNGILPAVSRKEVMKGITPARQRQMQRGIDRGAVIGPAGSLKEVKALYLLLEDLYTDRVKKPLPPFALFQNFYRNIQSENKGVILVVKYEDRIIGGMVCPFSAGHTVYEWYISSTRDEFRQLYPGVLATWAGIDYAIRNKFQYFDFMGLGSPHKSYGVRDFKKRFGGEILNLGRWHYVNNKTLYNLSLLGYKVMKRFAK